jgi:hypothetical protein
VNVNITHAGAWNGRGMNATTTVKVLTMLKDFLVFDDDLQVKR